MGIGVPGLEERVPEVLVGGPELREEVPEFGVDVLQVPLEGAAA